jgi:hypothetical protein
MEQSMQAEPNVVLNYIHMMERASPFAFADSHLDELQIADLEYYATLTTPEQRKNFVEYKNKVLAINNQMEEEIFYGLRGAKRTTMKNCKA